MPNTKELLVIGPRDAIAPLADIGTPQPVTVALLRGSICGPGIKDAFRVRAWRNPQRDDLEELLDHARRRNAVNGITGALVYAEVMFLQILEGDEVRVRDLMAKIRRDVRHDNVIVLREGEVPVAIFESWKMAYVSATPQQFARWAGLSVANDTIESVSQTTEENNRTAQFARDILSMLVPGDTTAGKLE